MADRLLIVEQSRPRRRNRAILITHGTDTMGRHRGGRSRAALASGVRQKRSC